VGPERLSLFRRRIQIALDVMTAIQFLHIGNDQMPSSFHGNINSASIVLKRDFTAQLIDCGLAKFVMNRNGSQQEAAVFNSAAGDIFSFGVILAELLTGKLQNHKDQCGAAFNFGKKDGENNRDCTGDYVMNLDPALGYDTWALPKYVKELADLANCCMRPKPEDRPTGEAVMEKLSAISSYCCSRNGDSGCLIPVGGSVPQHFELKSQNKCKFCRTFPPVSSQSVCAVCMSAEERRAQVAFCGDPRQVATTKAKRDASPPLSTLYYCALGNEKRIKRP
jgi:serine/threonine protein kinase